ncbi:hypothetical protein DFJ73DRAFT_775151 [Zopfochytrium polystomum]|nr:hypothetical protein DFJ73DRAFT_775151 [Zopfochytrium polystomum]
MQRGGDHELDGHVYSASIASSDTTSHSSTIFATSGPFDTDAHSANALQSLAAHRFKPLPQPPAAATAVPPPLRINTSLAAATRRGSVGSTQASSSTSSSSSDGAGMHIHVQTLSNMDGASIIGYMPLSAGSDGPQISPAVGALGGMVGSASRGSRNGFSLEEVLGLDDGCGALQPVEELQQSHRAHHHRHRAPTREMTAAELISSFKLDDISPVDAAQQFLREDDLSELIWG